MVNPFKKWLNGDSKPTEEAYPPLTPEQLWMVSLSAVFQYTNKDRCNTRMYPLARTDAKIAGYELSVKRWAPYPIEGDAHATIAETLAQFPFTDYLFGYGVDQRMPIAWEVANKVDIARFAFAAGYIDEPTAWQVIQSAAQLAQQRYTTWEQYSQDFVVGNQIWWDKAGIVDASTAEIFKKDADKALKILLDPANADSPWKLAPWPAH